MIIQSAYNSVQRRVDIYLISQTREHINSRQSGSTPRTNIIFLPTPSSPPRPQLKRLQQSRKPMPRSTPSPILFSRMLLLPRPQYPISIFQLLDISLQPGSRRLRARTMPRQRAPCIADMLEVLSNPFTFAGGATAGCVGVEIAYAELSGELCI